MGIATAGLVVAVLALILSLAFNYLQYKWRKEDRDQRRLEQEGEAARQERQEAEQQRKERMPPEIYNFGGVPNPLRISGSQHSAQGPWMVLWGSITVVNPTSGHIKVQPEGLEIDREDWEVVRFEFHLRSNDRERYDRISMMGNTKQDYDLYLFFPENKVPKGLTGALWLSSSNRPGDPFSIAVIFPS
jgi:hypothetical protein